MNLTQTEAAGKALAHMPFSLRMPFLPPSLCISFGLDLCLFVSVFRFYVLYLILICVLGNTVIIENM